MVGYTGDIVMLASPQTHCTYLSARNETRQHDVFLTNTCLVEDFDQQTVDSPWLADGLGWYKKKGRVVASVALIDTLLLTPCVGQKLTNLMLNAAQTQQEIDGVTMALEAVVNSDAEYFTACSTLEHVVQALSRTKTFLQTIRFRG